jgi:hypothetical protein
VLAQTEEWKMSKTQQTEFHRGQSKSRHLANLQTRVLC